MKKLSLIVAMAVILTIGGVFATWTYNDGTATAGTDTAGITITGLATSTPKGTISVSVGELKIHNDGSYNTVWDTTPDDTVTITFTPGATAADAIVNNGIGYTVTIEENFGTVKIGSDTIDIISIPVATFDLTQGDKASNFKATFNLRDKVNVTAAKLDTSAKHGTYSAALTGKSITITISEKAA